MSSFNRYKISVLVLAFFILLISSSYSVESTANNAAKAKASSNNNVPSKRALLSNYALLLDYEAFGPPSMSFELLEPSWWSWEPSGSSNASQSYPIKVVVYRKHTLEKIKTIYPIVPNKKQDYRYISLNQATRYLDKNISDNAISSITGTLRITRKQLKKLEAEL